MPFREDTAPPGFRAVLTPAGSCRGCFFERSMSCGTDRPCCPDERPDGLPAIFRPLKESASKGSRSSAAVKTESTCGPQRERPLYEDNGTVRTKAANKAVIEAAKLIRPMWKSLLKSGWKPWQVEVIMREAVQYETVFTNLLYPPEELR